MQNVLSQDLAHWQMMIQGTDSGYRFTQVHSSSRKTRHNCQGQIFSLSALYQAHDVRYAPHPAVLPGTQLTATLMRGRRSDQELRAQTLDPHLQEVGAEVLQGGARPDEVAQGLGRE